MACECNIPKDLFCFGFCIARKAFIFPNTMKLPLECVGKWKDLYIILKMVKVWFRNSNHILTSYDGIEKALFNRIRK